MARSSKTTRDAKPKQAESYQHRDAKSPMRPEVGTQAQFKKRKPPKTYRYESSLSPELNWDGQNPAREQGEALIREVLDAKKLEQAKAAAAKLKALSKPFLNWTGKAERLSFDVPTLPLFIHERLSTKAIVETLAGHKTDKQQSLYDLFGDPQHSITDQVLKAYEYQDDWVNRMVLGDSLVVMNSLFHYEGLGGQVQMIYMDPPYPALFMSASAAMAPSLLRQAWPRFSCGQAGSLAPQTLNVLFQVRLGSSRLRMPVSQRDCAISPRTVMNNAGYGVKFGSNFQPFIRKRDVSHNDDEDMTREPEMVQAYRDTWELGLHSYLTYLRDRLLLARELLTPSGSILVQISDENLHHVREVMDEVFGSENACPVILMRKSGWAETNLLPQVHDFILWYARSKDRIRYRQLYQSKKLEDMGEVSGAWVESPDGSSARPLSKEEREDARTIPDGWKLFFHDNLTSSGHSSTSSGPYRYKGKEYWPGVGKRTDRHWKTPPENLDRLAAADRLMGVGDTLRQKRYLTDFPFSPLGDHWDDTAVSGFADTKLYVVQTNVKAMERCLHMTTDPGDLVLDPTCGSGTTAYVAEQWGRRWITVDTSRVPLALARQRLLTATFPWYELKDETRRPAGGFVYKRKQNKKGEEVGGIVPHITLKSIANNEPPQEEILVDRPEQVNGITRVSGPFCFEATIPTPVDWEGDGKEDSGAVSPETYGSFVDRMLEVLRKSPVLRLEGNKTVTFQNVRPPAKTLSLSAEALTPALSPEGRGKGERNGAEKPVAFVFGPESGAVSEKLVYEAAREAHAKGYTHLYVIGFAIQPNARTLVDQCASVMGVPATYVQATPDLLMGDLLKNMRSSQIFSVCGLPEVKVQKVKPPSPQPSPIKGEGMLYQVELLGLDVFDPITMEVSHRNGDDVPVWFLDTDYNDLCFHVSQAFFPRTGAWDNLKKALKGDYDEAVWDHLAGTTSAPFEAGEHRQIAVKVIDDRGNELLVVKRL